MSIDWKRKIRETDCFQEENLIESLENKIKKITETECPSGQDHKINKVIVDLNIFKSDILAEDVAIQPSLFDFASNQNLSKKIILNITIQKYLSVMNFGSPYGKPKEYGIICINDGFGWSVGETKEMV